MDSGMESPEETQEAKGESMSEPTQAAIKAAEATPRPWEACQHNDCQWAIRVAGTRFHLIAITSQGNDEENARLIVDCVNQHDRIIAQRDALLAALVRIQTTGYSRQAEDQAIAAIALCQPQETPS